MSLYKITNESEFSSLTAQWNTNPTKSRFNINAGIKLIANIGGFDGYENVPVLFANDRLTQSSYILSSEDDLNTQINESLPTIDNVNLLFNSNIIKAIPSKGFNN